MARETWLTGRTVLVTGASRGIGAAIAAVLDERGARLVLASRSTSDLEDVRASLTNRDMHTLVPVDLRSDEELLHVVDTVTRVVKEHNSSLGAVVLNAGVAVNAPVVETTVEEWDDTFRINVRAPFLLCRDLVPLLAGGDPPGRVVMMGSVVSTAAYVHQAAYTASKHALYGFSRVLAKEVAAQGVIVHSVLPGGVATDLVRRTRPDIDTADLIQPAEVAREVAHLLDLTGNAVVDEVRIRRRNKQPT